MGHTETLAERQRPRYRMGRASLENHAHAQLSQTPGLGGLGLCVEPGAGRACQAPLGAGPGHAGRWGECRGWLLLVECSRPRGSLHSAAWLVRILGSWPHWLSSLSRPGLWRGCRAVDGEENQDSETGGTPKIPGSYLRSRTPWGILSIFSLASSTCCFISGPARRLLTWLLLAPGLQLSLSVSSFCAALSPS